MKMLFGGMSEQIHRFFDKNDSQRRGELSYVNPWHAAMSQALAHRCFSSKALRKGQPPLTGC